MRVHAASYGLISALLFATVMASPVNTTDETTSLEQQFNNAAIAMILKRLDLNVEGGDGMWRFSLEGANVTIITDEAHDRMRIIAPIVKAVDLDPQQMIRLLPANFDTALDARYALAQGYSWSAYIHPLSSLEDHTFISALGQVANLYLTYGKSYSSGGILFRGGDSEEIRQRELIDQLLQRGLAI